MRKPEELPEAEIEAAEERPSPHHHGTLDDDDDLLAHLRSVHGLDTPDHLSRSTLDGIHDRLHDETDATTD